MREIRNDAVYEDGAFKGYVASERQMACLKKLSKKDRGILTSKEASYLIQVWEKNRDTLKSVKETVKKYGFKAYAKYLKNVNSIRGKFAFNKAPEIGRLYRSEKDESVKALYLNYLKVSKCEEFAYK